MAENEATFKKADLVKSKRYAEDKDLLNAILSEEEEYTLRQVDKKILDFKKGKVK